MMFSVDELMKKYETSVGRNTNMLLGVVIDNRGRVPDADVERIAAFGNAIRKRYGTPAAQTSGKGDELTLSLRSPIRTDRIILQEDIRRGERVLAWHLEGIRPDDTVVTLCEGSNIGHKHIATFDPVEVKAVRLVVDDRKARPHIRNLSVFPAE